MGDVRVATDAAPDPDEGAVSSFNWNICRDEYECSSRTAQSVPPCPRVRTGFRYMARRSIRRTKPHVSVIPICLSGKYDNTPLILVKLQNRPWIY